MLSKSYEWDPNAKPKCNLWGQIWSVLDLRPKASNVNFEKNLKYSVELFLRSNIMSMLFFVQIGWTGSCCQAKMWFPTNHPPAPLTQPQQPPPSLTKQFIEIIHMILAESCLFQFFGHQFWEIVAYLYKMLSKVLGTHTSNYYWLKNC